MVNNRHEELAAADTLHNVPIEHVTAAAPAQTEEIQDGVTETPQLVLERLDLVLVF